MSLKLNTWDIQEHIASTEARQAYWLAALEEAGDDPEYMAQVLGDIAKSYGMSKIAQETGLSREGLYKSFGKNGNPSFMTVNKVANALGLKLTFQTS